MCAQIIIFNQAKGSPEGYHRMSCELDRLLSQQLLIPHFMPIIDSGQGAIVGYEALIRGPVDSPLHAPASLFPFAHKAGRLLELELLCRRLSITRFRELELPGRLFLNVTPNTLLEADFRAGETQRLMTQLGLEPEQLVLEITEQLPINDYALMREATDHYRQQGFQVALDDLGAGYAGLRSWSELRPQFVKIDRHFIEGIDRSPIKQEFVRSITDVARSIDCKVIAEGIEQEAEHNYLNDVGLTLQQGFYFSPPQPVPSRELPPRLGRARPVFEAHGSRSALLARIARPQPTLKADRTLGDAARRFRKHPELLSMAVLDQGKPVGILHRDTCLNLYLAPFGRELYERKSIRPHIDTQPLVLEEHHSLEQIARQLDLLDLNRLRTDFIITRNGHYLGMGAIVELLKLVTQLQLNNARHANPLTLLPGTVPTNDEINRRLEAQQSFAIGYLDIDNFKAFNDRYGFHRGDQAIQLLADCLRRHCDPERDFIGHIGGDDFLVLLEERNWRHKLRHLQQEFSTALTQLYDPDDRERGYLESTDRNGGQQRLPLATLSIGVAHPALDRCRSHLDVATLASDAKTLAKQQPGNSLVINRRRGPTMEQLQGELALSSEQA
ncbi:bifunctional diguanylate cyclase/phosphodiesterase [Motiliproteus sediminis]|uniref:bifunctional diguanylate cyclase/phosphodiesterase n=1 Tax=Motiliproteus sediminis TaxID=1468178 RepID=UPI001AEF58DE|nr:bifunctional diguanylate cyclase/phosphodiesterase [Motiliproteus sediminis]